jgi:hypothetical protein
MSTEKIIRCLFCKENHNTLDHVCDLCKEKGHKSHSLCLSKYCEIYWCHQHHHYKYCEKMPITKLECSLCGEIGHYAKYADRRKYTYYTQNEYDKIKEDDKKFLIKVCIKDGIDFGDIQLCKLCLKPHHKHNLKCSVCNIDYIKIKDKNYDIFDYPSVTCKLENHGRIGECETHPIYNMDEYSYKINLNKID